MEYIISVSSFANFWKINFNLFNGNKQNNEITRVHVRST